MPSKPRPKIFTATRDMTWNGQQFSAGDPVPPGSALSHFLTFGDRFVSSVETNPKPSKGEPALSEETDHA